jgi:hypothetical protein
MWLLRISLFEYSPLENRAVGRCQYYLVGIIDLSRKRPQWNITAKEKDYGDKDYSI